MIKIILLLLIKYYFFLKDMKIEDIYIGAIIGAA